MYLASMGVTSATPSTAFARHCLSILGRLPAQSPKPKPVNATVPKPSGEGAKVAHLSDFHLDPRYVVSPEAN